MKYRSPAYGVLEDDVARYSMMVISLDASYESSDDNALPRILDIKAQMLDTKGRSITWILHHDMEIPKIGDIYTVEAKPAGKG